jgi:hypothetical protein
MILLIMYFDVIFIANSSSTKGIQMSSTTEYINYSVTL